MGPCARLSSPLAPPGQRRQVGCHLWYNLTNTVGEDRSLLERLLKLDKVVRRTRTAFFGRVADLFDRQELDEALWDELEELLIQADVGVSTTEYLIDRMRSRVRAERIVEPARAREVLFEELIALLDFHESARGEARRLKLQPGRLNVILVVGVNGSGKTTTIAKLARSLQNQRRSVVLAAGDTFRAAAIDQLKIWGERARVPVVASQPGSDPGSVVYDAWQAAKARNADVLIVDTAGRLHTKYNLMEELKKVRRVLAKLDPTAPHEVLLVLDATTGQNAVAQAREFLGAVGVTGIVMAKVDGTAKGGVIFAIGREFQIPIKLLGTGEQLDDLDEFDPRAFVEALLRPS
ncbi:MAG: signal recognition particle-docking protein FtsY [Chloroflexi bacterium]|nr:signal recognition particle-docking protein FtsY [Chloroflexota bacterium]